MDKKLILWYASAVLVGIMILIFIFAFFVKKEKHSEIIITSDDIMLTSSVLNINKYYIITNYTPVNFYVTLTSGETIFAFRKFKRDGVPSFLAVNPATLKTMIINEEEMEGYQKPLTEFDETKLYKLINAKKPIKKIESAGYALTIDLCEKPKKKSHKFEKRLFDFLEKTSVKKGEAIPVGIAISATWLKEEKQSFEEIIRLRDNEKIDITWINHSANHPVNKGKFLTAKNVNFEMEVLETEKYLLEMGEIPSIFFRFPGLVSNKELLNQLAGLSLIALDANAWIAKKEKITAGSVILIHGNGNEPQGIEMLLKFFEKQDPNFASLPTNL